MFALSFARFSMSKREAERHLFLFVVVRLLTATRAARGLPVGFDFSVSVFRRGLKVEVEKKQKIIFFNRPFSRIAFLVFPSHAPKPCAARLPSSSRPQQLRARPASCRARAEQKERPLRSRQQRTVPSLRRRRRRRRRRPNPLLPLRRRLCTSPTSPSAGSASSSCWATASPRSARTRGSRPMPCLWETWTSMTR